MSPNYLIGLIYGVFRDLWKSRQRKVEANANIERMNKEARYKLCDTCGRLPKWLTTIGVFSATGKTESEKNIFVEKKDASKS